MLSISIQRPTKVRRAFLVGFVVLVVFALSGLGFYGSAQSEAPVVGPNVRSFAGGAITILQLGKAVPAPSDVVVAVSTSAVASKVTVTITGFTHACWNDVDILLQGPTGGTDGADVMILSDVGDCTSAPPASGPVNITLDDAAASSLGTGALASGTFKPTNLEGDTFDTGAEPWPDLPRSGTTLAFFNGLNVNGTWHLWVLDDTGGDAGSIASWSLNITFGPTLARMFGGSAVVDDDGVVELKWQTSHEVDNLGFNIYREVGGQRTRVNKQIIAGSALVAGQGTSMTAGRNYRWRDAAAQPGKQVQYWIEAEDINGGSLLSGPFIPAHAPGKLTPQPPASTLGDLGRPSGSGRVSLMNVQAAPPGQTAFKIGVKQSGYYRVNQADLVTAGFSSGIDPRNLQLFEDGSERPIFVQGEQDGRLDAGDYIEFYGRSLDTAYTDTHVYQLVAGSGPGLRIKRAKGKGKTTGPDSFLFTTELRERSVYFPGFKNGEREKFFGAVVARQPVERNLPLQHIDTEAPSPATMDIGLQGVTAGEHNVKVNLNSVDIGSVRFDGKAAGNARIEVPHSMLKEGNNAIKLTAEGGDSDVSLLSAVRLSYWHTYAADDGSLEFTAAGSQRVNITGFASSSIRVLDVTDAAKDGVREVAGTVAQDGSGFSVGVNVPGSGVRTLLAFAGDRIGAPASIGADIPSSWRKRSNSADIVIFTREDFFPALEPLKTHRESQGYQVALVNIEDVYDEFGFGNKSPQAIKDFLEYATTKWKGKPRFALFAGDSSFDPKNYLGEGFFDIVPTKLIETQYLETASDDWFADFNDDGLPEMAVGRLPVRTAGELSALVRKIVGYDSAAPSSDVLLISDNDGAFDFEGQNVALQGLIPGHTNRIDRSTTDDATARMQLLGYLNSGQRIVNYFGHGSLDIWRDNILTSGDALSLSNSGRLSLFVPMTCLNGYFHDTVVDSLAEAMLKAPNGGAVAAWASTGMCDLGEQAILNREFYRLLFGNSITLGEAAMRAKALVQDKDVRRTWVLLGDPATKLR